MNLIVMYKPPLGSAGRGAGAAYVAFATEVIWLMAWRNCESVIEPYAVVAAGKFDGSVPFCPSAMVKVKVQGAFVTITGVTLLTSGPTLCLYFQFFFRYSLQGLSISIFSELYLQPKLKFVLAVYSRLSNDRSQIKVS